MSTEAQADKKDLAGKPDYKSFVGLLQTVTASGYTVVINSGVVPALPGSGYVPAVGEKVIVWFLNEIAYVMGPATPNPAQGTVVSVASGIVTLTTTVGTITCPYSSTLTPTAGQIMQLLWSGGPYGISVQSAAPSGPIVPGGGGSAPTTHVDTFSALSSGSYQSRWWTPQVYASNTNVGLWFYGTKIPDTLPAGAAIQSIQIYISPVQITGSNPLFVVHNYASQPGGAPTSLTGSTSIAVAPGWVSLPIIFGQSLRASGGQLGVGVDTGGFSIFNSTGADGLSGALRITSVY